MGTINQYCQICGAENENVDEYDKWVCASCGQQYGYEEGHCIVLTDEQRQLLRDHAKIQPQLKSLKSE